MWRPYFTVILLLVGLANGYDCYGGAYPSRCISPCMRAPCGCGYICDPCLIGHYCPAPGDSYPTPCLPGYFCTSYATAPTLCAPNTQTLVSRATSCIACTPGNATNSGGGGPCCPAGYASIVGATRCDICPVGRYEAGRQCVMCPIGTYSNATGIVGVSSCAQCPPGLYQPNQGSTFCVPCPIGSYKTSAGGNCTLCPASTQNLATGLAAACAACPAGRSSARGGPCCPRGYSSPPLATSCSMCSPGQWGDGANCFSCPAGTFVNTSGATALSDCLPCAAGQYSGNGSAACAPCAADRGSVCLGGSEARRQPKAAYARWVHTAPVDLILPHRALRARSGTSTASRMPGLAPHAEKGRQMLSLVPPPAPLVHLGSGSPPSALRLASFVLSERTRRLPGGAALCAQTRRKIS